MMKRGKFVLCIIAFFQIFLLLGNVRVNATLIQKHVLVLKSYNDGDKWENEIQEGIENILEKYYKIVDVHFESLDIRDYNRTGYYEKLKEYYEVKYKDHKFDSIIVCDNDALEFIKKYGDILFKGVPVVFCGINNYSPKVIKGYSNYTGIAEEADVKGTIAYSLKIFNNTKTIAVVADSSTTGLENIEIMKKVSSFYKGKIEFVFIKNTCIDDVIKEINSLPKKSSIVFLQGQLRDEGGEYLSQERTADILTEKCTLPFISCWDFYLGHGIVGGDLLKGNLQGEEAAKIVLMILNGEKPENIKVVQNYPQNYVYDYGELDKYSHINIPLLTKLINKPSNIYNIQKSSLWLIACIIIILSFIIIIILLFSNKKIKTAEKNLKVREEQLRILIDSTPDLISLKDEKHRLLEANKSTLEFFGVDIKENADSYRGKVTSELDFLNKKSLDIIKKLESFNTKVLENEKILRGEETLEDNRGIIHTFDTIRVPIYYEDGTQRGLLIMRRDITESKKNEEDRRHLRAAMEYDQVKTEFFANISHELRTPLNVILSTLQLLELYIKNEKIVDKGVKLERKMYTLKQNCFRLLRLVNNLIDITKIDSGYFKLHLSNGNIVESVEEITLSVVEYVESIGIELIFDTDIEEKYMAFDADKIERVMLNLLSNAVKFTEPGGKILVSLKDLGDYVSVSVKDNGIGIPRDKQKIIFERFRQVDKTFARNKEGSGIGLSLVKSLIELHGGDITLKSNLGEGSDFIFKIPVKIVHENEEIKEIAPRGKVEKIEIEFSDIYNLNKQGII